MKTTVVTCDHCGADLTRPRVDSRYYLVVRPEAVAAEAGFRYESLPLAGRDHHFCNLDHLAAYVARVRDLAAAPAGAP